MVLITINLEKKKNLKIAFSIFFVAVCLFVKPALSFSIGVNEHISYISQASFEENLHNENYTTIIAELPELIHKPDEWRKIYSNVNSKPLNEVVEKFGGLVYINWPEYAHAKILLSKENYTQIVDTLSPYFKIRNNTFFKISLADTKKIIGAPSIVYRWNGATNESFFLNGIGRTIAILDTGIDTGHVAFTGKNIQWADVVYGRGTPYDDYGHGTTVASIAAGVKVGNGNYMGIAPVANLVMVKVCDNRGYCDPAWIAQGLQLMQQTFFPDVISMSLGLGDRDIPVNWCDCTTTDTDIQAICTAVNALVTNNQVPIVVAAGNEGPFSHIGFPACMNNAIAVGASAKYPDIDDNWYTSWFPVTDPPEIAKIHALVIVNGKLVLEKTWEGTYKIVLGSNIISGFQKKFTSIGKVDVYVETQHKHRNCYEGGDRWNYDPNLGRTWWEPGDYHQNDEHWIWSFNADPSKPVIIEIGAWPRGERGGTWSCYGDANDWRRIYYNDYTCSGTALSCDSHDYDETECTLNGCSWNNDCSGTPKACSDRSQINGDYCGTPSSTGCTAAWNIRDVAVNIYQINSGFYREGMPAFFSSRGPAVQDSNLRKPLVTAPGVDICSATTSGGGSKVYPCYQAGYDAESGTSMSTPIVAGEIALLYQLAGIRGLARPNVNQIINAITQTDEKVFPWNPDFFEGFGRINMRKAGKVFCLECLIDSMGFGGGGGGGGGRPTGPPMLL